MREWKKNNPCKVRQQKKQYYARNKDKRRNVLNQWREQNPEKVRIQKRHYRERKAWPRRLRTWQRRKKSPQRKPCRYDPDKMVLLDARVELIDFRKTTRQSAKDKMVLLEALVELIDFRKTTRQSAKDMQAMDDFDPNEILKGLFPAKSPKRKPAKRKPTKKQYDSSSSSSDSEVDEALAKELEAMIAEPESPQREQYNSSDSSDLEVDEALAKELEAMIAEPESPPSEQYNSSSSDSEVDEALAKELEAMIAEPEDPVKRRINQIRNNRKKAGENRVARIQKRREEEAMIVEMASELDKMMFMIHDMGKRFAEFEREDKVERASQFEYSRTIEITTELMSELEQYLFF